MSKLSNKQKKVWKKRLAATMVLGATVAGVATTSTIVLAEKGNEQKVESPTKYEKALGKSDAKKAISSFASSDYVSVLDDPESTIVDDKTIISSDYDFSAGFIEGKTTVETIGEGWEDGLRQPDGSLSSRGIHISEKDIVKGETGVIYHHVSANGQDVDMKMTVKDFTGYDQGQIGTLAINVEDQIGSWINRMVDITFDVEFLKAGTNEQIPLTGYYTWSDIDWLQSVTINKDMVDKSDGILVSSDSWLQTKTLEDGSKKFAEVNNEGSDDLDPWAMFTVLFRDVSDFSYTFSTNADPSKEWTEENDWEYAWQGNTAVKPAQSEVPAPTKLVSDSDELDVTSNTLDEMKEVYHYKINQIIPGELEKLYHKSYELFDSVIPELERVSDITIVDETGTDRSSWFNDLSKGNEIHVVAKDDAMSDSEFYAHTYSFEFDAQVKVGADLSKYLNEDGFYHFPNEAKAVIDGEEKTTPPTDTIVKDYDSDPQKYNVDENGEETTDALKGKKGDSVSYSIRNQAPYSITGKEFSLTDNVSDYVDIDSDSVKVEMTDDNVSESNSNVDNSTTDVEDEDLKVTLNKWIVKAEEYLADSENYDETAIATLQEFTDTAKEDLAKEDVSDKVLQTDIDALISAIKVLDEEVDSDSDKDKDTSTNKETVDVKDAKWTDITDEGTLTADKETGQIKWTLSKEKSSMLAGKHYRLTFGGTLSKDLDYSLLEQEDGYAIVPNVATETIGDEEKDTNEVDRLVPEEEEPEVPVDPETPKEPETTPSETPKESVVKEDTGAKVLPSTLPKTGVETKAETSGNGVLKAVAAATGTTVSLFGFAKFFKK